MGHMVLAIGIQYAIQFLGCHHVFTWIEDRGRAKCTPNVAATLRIQVSYWRADATEAGFAEHNWMLNARQPCPIYILMQDMFTGTFHQACKIWLQPRA